MPGAATAGHELLMAAERSPETGSIADILRERALRLSAAPADTDGGATVEVLECRLGVERYALEMRLLHGVQRATDLTPVPCTPAFVAGLLNVRGEIVTVLDLGVALSLGRAGAPGPGPEGHNVLLVDLSGVRVGLLVDDIIGMRTLALDRLERAPSGSDVVRGVADARVVLLDLERLLADGRFDVMEEVA